MTAQTHSHSRRVLMRFAWLSIAAALFTISLKTLAWWLTGSVGLLSDALESSVNLIGAVVALAVLGIAARPPDATHPYGHSKAEYFSSGVEGGLIILAAIAISATAVHRIIYPQPLDVSFVGLSASIIASMANLAVARILLRVGRAEDSITLEADAHHLMTDVWTSAGVIAGVALVFATGWQILDPLIALAVAANITWTGVKVFRRSVKGLMDAALPDDELAVIETVLARHRKPGSVEFHALRTRIAASRRFISIHVLVPGDWSVGKGHDLADRIEQEIQSVLPGASVISHLEPIEDPRSYLDIDLDQIGRPEDPHQH
ncbi:MAG: cation diffusion facilitator family transporter [Aquisalimonadaceae bacterium]